MFSAYLSFKNPFNSLFGEYQNFAIYGDLDDFGRYLRTITWTRKYPELDNTRRVISLFLEELPKVKNKLSIDLNGEYITLYETKYIERTKDRLEFGERPLFPVQDLEGAMKTIARGIDWKDVKKVREGRMAMSKLFNDHEYGILQLEAQNVSNTADRSRGR
jgi:hypothetical protein